jgi:hypothetical protein
VRPSLQVLVGCDACNRKLCFLHDIARELMWLFMRGTLKAYASRFEFKSRKSKWGGGAGRPKGSSNKPKISDHITDDEVKALVVKAT